MIKISNIPEYNKQNEVDTYEVGRAAMECLDKGRIYTAI